MGKFQKQHIGADQADRWRSARKRRRRILRPAYLLALIFVPLAVFLSQNPDIIGAAPSLVQIDASPSASLLSTGAGCNIKGNVSIDTGEHIFHVPGQKYYSRTRIRPEFGERWFCSEAEAMAAGWRKAWR
ncbi:hypothetical protein EN962_24415 [Mesorhizobium sp. M7A.F.Ca.CA.001.09.2.1]|uniref:Succinoglycan biosynthesis protein exoi n=1 Tax=Mesorhizobium ciceri TaxID=39645 RepID=A0AB38T601_9HYPH|nr:MULTISPECIES: hypothetical protein [Mesorhizobium]RUY39302.1 hypothetical protein EN981_23200 [Mesorhizobium sp. M7A.F.Ca.CA.001.13.2.1]MDF3216289.1 hypothetical protein [Mesorhizobium ciceri]RUY55752.1 hypothetical protein EN965_34425 [Mesorhizobium sp. M7A.F.Ca.CA.001.05.1.1]RUY62420.1 hypothetical protein EN980_30600 [Mesorhizobium sp. M7A.F.Ca.CA.001.13.1.1]RUY75144.1 hypothetical protein EN962_24415 [Mesorhizobium sp. M7A.F.Ca.CA.001.09.2.1]